MIAGTTLDHPCGSELFMRVLGIGDYGDLGDLYAHLLRRGHEVRMAVREPAYQDVFRGLVPHTVDWREELEWIRAAGRDGVIVFETAHDGVVQDELRHEGFQVVGGCAFGDRLEGDRDFGQVIMRQAGMQTAQTTRFTDVSAALSYIRQRPRRYVCKHNGHHHPSTRNYVGELADGADVVALLSQYQNRTEEAIDLILMDFIEGVETGIGAYFNGRTFIGPVCLDWEHKRFFPGDLGELTCEMGTVVTYRGSDRLFRETIAPLAPLLAEHGYCGYININTIINADGIWPLEFTCRFGYPGFAILDALHVDGWENILRALCGADVPIATHPGYAIGVVLTAPPFPYLADPHPSRGLPISFRGELAPDDLRHLHYGEVDFSTGDPVIGGASGYVMVVTGRGEDVAAARRSAYRLIDRTVIPNVRYRADIGCRFIERDELMLTRLGYLPAPVADAGQALNGPHDP